MQFDGLAIMGLSHYTMLCKHGKRMRDFGGVFSFSLVIFYTIFGGVFNKTIIPFAFVGHEIGYSSALRPRWLFTISYPTCSHGIIILLNST